MHQDPLAVFVPNAVLDRENAQDSAGPQPSVKIGSLAPANLVRRAVPWLAVLLVTVAIVFLLGYSVPN